MGALESGAVGSCEMEPGSVREFSLPCPPAHALVSQGISVFCISALVLPQVLRRIQTLLPGCPISTGEEQGTSIQSRMHQVVLLHVLQHWSTFLL